MIPVRRWLISFFLNVYYFFKKLGALKCPIVRKIFVQTYFLYKKLIEDSFAKLVKKNPQLFSKGHIIDVGAGIGYTTKIFLGALSEGYQIHSFEPESFNCLLFHENFKATPKVRLQKAAVSERSGRACLALNEGHFADHRLTLSQSHSQWDGRVGQVSQEVETISLDDYFKRDLKGQTISFIKIDAQGHEVKILKGAQQVFQANPGLTLALEYDPKSLRESGDSDEELFGFLKRLNFKLYSMNLTPVETKRELDALLGDKGYCDILCSKKSF